MVVSVFLRQLKGIGLAALLCFSLLIALMASTFSSTQDAEKFSLTKDDNAWVGTVEQDEAAVPHHAESLPLSAEETAETDEASPELESEGEFLSVASFVGPIDDPLRYLSVYSLGLPIDRNESLLRPPRA